MLKVGFAIIKTIIIKWPREKTKEFRLPIFLKVQYENIRFCFRANIVRGRNADTN